MSVRTPAQAIAAALKITTGYNGECLKYVRTAYGVGAKYLTAAKAWANAKYKHPGSDLSDAPDGAIVHLHKPGEAAGHVGILTGGKLRSTDSSVGHPGTQPLSYWTHAGYTVDGWAEDVNGVRIAGLKPQPAKPSKPANGSPAVLKPGSTGAEVKELQAGLRRAFPLYAGALAVDGSYGPKTTAAVKEFQRRAGLERDGITGPKTRAALARYGVTL